MRWVVWILVWIALLVAAGWYPWRKLRELWARSERLGETLAEAEALVAAATEPVAGADRAAPEPVELAIFRDPAEVALERERLRRTLREERDIRRRASLPGWARRVDSTDADNRKA